ncbi:MAG: MerR family transcriptional regulator [Oscillospiraceae bacterium]|nr:MerR family transcriptional regulator [Oscillospiraceae bacterium]
MLTVGNFAILCACTPQTLRYYDRVELLKPAKVDEWTGYRYYEESQLPVFTRIRCLQEAGFTIGEIRRLLDAPAEELREAAARKQAALETRMRLLRELQSGFPEEKNMEEVRIREAMEAVGDILGKLGPEDLAEAGLGPEQLPELRERLTAYWTGVFQGVGYPVAGEGEKWTDTGWRASGWADAGEALASLPPLEDGGSYRLELTFAPRQKPFRERFIMVLTGAVLLRNEGKKLRFAVEIDAETMGLGEENSMRLSRLA